MTTFVLKKCVSSPMALLSIAMPYDIIAKNRILYDGTYLSCSFLKRIYSGMAVF